MLLLLTPRPGFNLPEDSLPSSLQAPLSVPTEVTGICGRVGPVKEGKISQFLSIGEFENTGRRGWNSQQAENPHNRDLFAMKSGTDVRHGRKCIVIHTDLIGHQCFMEIFHQAIDPLYVPGVC